MLFRSTSRRGGGSDVRVVRGDDADDLAHEEHDLGGEELLVRAVQSEKMQIYL